MSESLSQGITRAKCVACVGITIHVEGMISCSLMARWPLMQLCLVQPGKSLSLGQADPVQMAALEITARSVRTGRKMSSNNAITVAFSVP